MGFQTADIQNSRILHWCQIQMTCIEGEKQWSIQGGCTFGFLECTVLRQDMFFLLSPSHIFFTQFLSIIQCIKCTVVQFKCVASKQSLLIPVNTLTVCVSRLLHHICKWFFLLFFLTSIQRKWFIPTQCCLGSTCALHQTDKCVYSTGRCIHVPKVENMQHPVRCMYSVFDIAQTVHCFCKCDNKIN